jgi:hypothetical protein
MKIVKSYKEVKAELDLEDRKAKAEAEAKRPSTASRSMEKDTKKATNETTVLIGSSNNEVKDTKVSELEGTILSMLFLGSMIYTLGDLGHVAEKFGLQEQDLKYLSKDFKELLFSNYDISKVKFDADEVPGQPISASIVEKMIERVEEFNQACGSELTVRGFEQFRWQFGDTSLESYSPTKPFAFLNNFDAEFHNHELVYGITVSKGREKMQGRIEVTFRGSVELSDWLHNITIPFEEIRLRITGDKAFLIEGAHFTRIQIDVDIALDLKELLGDEPIRVHRGFLSKYAYSDCVFNE